MATYPLYCHDDPVPCFSCGAPLLPARDGDIVGFGDGSGNRELKCGCGWKTIFDVTKSREKQAAHMALHERLFAAVRSTLHFCTTPFYGPGRPPAPEPMKRGAKKGRDLAPAPPVPVSIMDGFDIGDMITASVEELRHGR